MLQTTSIVDDLRGQVAGTVVGPRDDGWDQARLGWNLSVDQRPAAVVEVAGVADVVAAVRTAGTHGVAVAAQPRGRGATRSLDGSILLRFGRMDGLHVDPDRRITRVEPGVRWTRLNEALTGTGLAGLAGSTGDTSVVGLTLGGGLSWFGRRYGLGAHRILAAELVDPAGEHLRVTRATDPELFWALRGGGGEFGIVTALELELLPASHIHGGRLVWTVDHAEAVLRAFVELTAVAPEELTAWAWLLNLPDVEFVPEPLRGRWSAAVDLTYLGDGADAERFLGPLRRLPPPFAGALGTVPLAELGDIAAEPTDPTPVVDDGPLLNRFDDAAVDTLLEAVAPGEPAPPVLFEVRHLGGAFARPAPDHGVIGHLPEPYLLVAGGPVPTPELAVSTPALLEHVRTAMGPYLSGRVAPNFGNDAAAIHPPDVLDRLRDIKRRRDPRGVIRGNRPLLPDLPT